MKETRSFIAMAMTAVLVATAVTGVSAVPASASTPVKDVVAVTQTVSVPNDIYYQRQWALPVLQASFTRVETGEVIVAVLDSGIDVAHEDLAGKVTGSVNFSDSRTESDVQGHGTHIAGILAANINNGIGIAGISGNIRLLNVKVVEDNGMVWPSNVAKGIVWAVDHGARVINMSLTMPTDSPKLAEAVKYAAEHKVIMLAAAGNRISSKTYPAAYPEVIAVGAINADGTLWVGSQTSDKVDVYAPGSEIYSTVPGNKYDYKSGSSMATAYASGTAAVILNGLMQGKGQCPECTEIRSTLKSISSKLLK
jgi:thermitase